VKPYERNLMQKRTKIKAERLLVKHVVVGGLCTLALGAIVKINYLLDDRLDKKYDQKEIDAEYS
jgi:hypothetical protein